MLRLRDGPHFIQIIIVALVSNQKYKILSRIILVMLHCFASKKNLYFEAEFCARVCSFVRSFVCKNEARYD